MYKSKEEVKANVELARKTNYWQKKEHNWFESWRRLDKICNRKPELYVSTSKF